MWVYLKRRKKIFNLFSFLKVVEKNCTDLLKWQKPLRVLAIAHHFLSCQHLFSIHPFEKKRNKIKRTFGTSSKKKKTRKFIIENRIFPANNNNYIILYFSIYSVSIKEFVMFYLFMHILNGFLLVVALYFLIIFFKFVFYISKE